MPLFTTRAARYIGEDGSLEDRSEERIIEAKDVEGAVHKTLLWYALSRDISHGTWCGILVVDKEGGAHSCIRCFLVVSPSGCADDSTNGRAEDLEEYKVLTLPEGDLIPTLSDVHSDGTSISAPSPYSAAVDSSIIYRNQRYPSLQKLVDHSMKSYVVSEGGEVSVFATEFSLFQETTRLEKTEGEEDE